MELLVIPLLFATTYLLSSFYSFSDRFYHWTRRYERLLDIDEIVLALMVSLIGFIWFAYRRIRDTKILMVRNHELLKRVLEVQEAERKEIAQYLHDDLGQYLNAIQTRVKSLHMDAPHGSENQAILQQITHSADHAYLVTRRMIYHLRPVALDDLGLAAALEHLVSSWKSLEGGVHQSLPTQIELNIADNIDRLSEQANIAIFRIVQEAMTNIAKHAEATKAFVLVNTVMYQNAKYLKISIEDNGKGFDVAKCMHKGYGLPGIAERIEALSGELQIISKPHLYTKIIAMVPNK